MASSVNDPYMMLDSVRPVSLDIWRVERCVYVWPS